MSDAKIVLSAVDQTKAAFESVKGNLQGLHTSATTVTSALGALGVAGAALTFAASIKGAIDAADQINKLAQRTGIATEQLSQLQFAAKLSDVSTESLTTGIKKLNVSIAEGLAGDKAKVEMFRNLGISLTDASGKAKTADKIMLEMAGTFSSAKDGALKTAYAVGLMGKAGDEMIPLLNGGTQAIAEMMGKAEKLGLTISKEFAQKAEDFNDNLTIIKRSADKLTIALASDLVDGLGKTVKAMADAAVEGGKFSAMIVGIQTLLTGDDRHKNNVALVEDTELKLQLENSLTALQAAGYKADSANVVARQRALDEVNARLKTTLTYRAQLAAIDEKEAKAEAAKPKKDKDLPKIKSDTATAATASEYDALIKRINEKIAAEDAELAKGRELTEYEKFEAKLIADIASSTKDLTEKEMIEIDTKVAKARAINAANVANKNALEANKAAAKFILESEAEIAAALAQDGQERNRIALSISDQTAALADNAKLLELEGRLLGSTDKDRAVALGNLRIEIELRKKLEELDRSLAYTGTDEATIKILAAERERRRELLITNADVEKAQVAERARLDEFQQVWGSIDQTAHDTFVNIFDGGSNAFKKLGQSLKASLLDLLYQATLKKWIFNIGASVSGGGGLAGVASTGAVQGGASALLSGSTSFLGAGFSSTMQNGMISGFSANMANIGTLVEGGSYLTALSAAMPYIGAIVAIGSLLAGSFSGETRSGGQYVADASGTPTFRAGPSGGDPGASQVVAGITATEAAINQTLKALGSSATLVGFQAGYESSGKGRGGVFSGGTLSTGATFGESGTGNNYAGTMFEKTSTQSPSIDEALQNFGTDLKQATLQALQAADVPGILGEWLKQLGDPEALSGGALDAALARINKALTEKATLEEQYYALTHTDAENLARAREKERAGLDETNQALYDQVMALQDAKNAAVESVTGIQALSDTMKSLRGETGNLQVQLLQAQGNEPGARSLQRSLDTAGYTADELALYDYNQALRDQIDAVKAATAAQTEAQNAAKVLAQQSAGLDTQILQLEGNTQALRDRELANLDATLQPLQQRIYDLQDEAAATAAANALKQQSSALETQILQLQGDTQALRDRELAAMDASLQPLQARIYALQDEAAAAAAAAAISNERYGLETQLLQLQGDTATLRARELETLDPSNRALQETIWALQDAAAQSKTAATSTAQYSAAVADTSKATDEAKNALMAAYGREQSELQQTIDKHRGYANSLRQARDAMWAGKDSPLDPAARTAEALRQYNATFSGAMGGNADALGSLQSVGNSYLEALKDSSPTKTDFDLGFAKVAGGLTMAAAQSDAIASTAQLQLDAMTHELDALGLLQQTEEQGFAALLEAYRATLAGATGSTGATGAGATATVGNTGGGGIDTSGVLSDAAVAAFITSNWNRPSSDIYDLLANQGVDHYRVQSIARAAGIPGFAAGGWHGGGWAMVGEQGPELAYMPPAQIYSAGTSRSIAGGAGNAELVAEVRSLNARVDALLDAAERGNADQKRTADAVNGGNRAPILVEIATA